jgi:hypothetical protein
VVEVDPMVVYADRGRRIDRPASCVEVMMAGANVGAGAGAGSAKALPVTRAVAKMSCALASQLTKGRRTSTAVWVPPARPPL